MRIQHCLTNLSIHEKNLLGTNRVSIVLEDNVDYSNYTQCTCFLQRNTCLLIMLLIKFMKYMVWYPTKKIIKKEERDMYHIWP
jgi:hypothetical protein